MIEKTKHFFMNFSCLNLVLNFENFINLLNFWRALNFPVNTPILHVVLPDC